MKNLWFDERNRPHFNCITSKLGWVNLTQVEAFSLIWAKSYRGKLMISLSSLFTLWVRSDHWLLKYSNFYIFSGSLTLEGFIWNLCSGLVWSHQIKFQIWLWSDQWLLIYSIFFYVLMSLYNESHLCLKPLYACSGLSNTSNTPTSSDLHPKKALWKPADLSLMLSELLISKDSP